MHQQIEAIKQVHAFPIVKMRRLMEETDILRRVTELQVSVAAIRRLFLLWLSSVPILR